MSGRPHRLRDFDYVGLHRYSLTFCVHERRHLFVQLAPVARSIAQIGHAACRDAFAVLAYCFMPDHLHLLVEGMSETSDLVAFARVVKQRTSYYCFRATKTPVWQKGYYEHVLRNDESVLAVARYILANPVRAGLVAEPQQYPFSGSFVWTWPELMELWQAIPEWSPSDGNKYPRG